MAPKYTLHYFDVPARGEFIRVLFHHVGEEFVDKRYTFAELPQIKSDDAFFPLGQVPILEINGQENICQSHAIVRYLANEFNLYGQTNQEKAIVDQVLDTLKPIEENTISGFFFTKDPVEKEAKIKKVFEEDGRRAFKMIENFLKSNQGGYVAGDKISVGDIHILVTLETLFQEPNTAYRNFLDSYPLIKALNDRVRASEMIKAYLDKRGPPVFNFQ